MFFLTSEPLCAGRFGLSADAIGRLNSSSVFRIMLLDFEVQRCTRRCAATDRALQPGDVCYSVLEISGAVVTRKDFCTEGWSGAPDGALGWWKSRVPEPTAKRIKLAPNEVLLELFDQLAERTDQTDLRYVLTLLLIRRRVLRLEEVSCVRCQASVQDVPDTRHPTPDTLNLEVMHVFCPRRDASYEVTVNMPSGDRIEGIQQQLSELLIAGAE